MIQGDYVEQKRVAGSGKTVTDRIVTSTTGVQYIIGNRLGAGSVGKVYRARRLSDRKECVFKEFVPSEKWREVHRIIHENIVAQMKAPLMEEDEKTRLKDFVGPMDKDSLIELPASKGFGYVMERVDTKVFVPLLKLWHPEVYPDAAMMCRIGSRLAYLFRRLHARGWCYKDISEKNLYFNSKTGEVRIIDCDNIGLQSAKTITGTPGYIAPEVYRNETPDKQSDYYGLAVMLYRLMIGGYPMEGRKTEKYLMDHNAGALDAMDVVYGKMALFAFDPVDTSNSIRNMAGHRDADLYANFVEAWDHLPKVLQDGFIRTFSSGLAEDNRHLRTADRAWMKIFEEVEKNELVRCTCGKMQFAHPSGGKCVFCGSRLKARRKPVGPAPKSAPKTTPATKPTPVPAAGELSAVTFRVKRDIAPTNTEMKLARGQNVVGADTYPGMKDDWIKLQYSRSMNRLAVVNQTSDTWIVTDQGIKKDCPPGSRVLLTKGMIITVMRRKLQLTVQAIR